jgi:hypothetical protein
VRTLLKNIKFRQTHKKSREREPFLGFQEREPCVWAAALSAFLSASCPLELFLIVTHRRLLMMELIGFIRWDNRERAKQKGGERGECRLQSFRSASLISLRAKNEKHSRRDAILLISLPSYVQIKAGNADENSSPRHFRRIASDSYGDRISFAASGMRRRVDPIFTSKWWILYPLAIRLQKYYNLNP